MLRVLRVLFVSMVCAAAVATVASPASAGSDPPPWFFAQLSLTNGGHTVLAGGPMNWGADEAWATIENVTITQGAVAGTSTTTTTVQNGKDVNWWLNAGSLRQFTPGLADAYALELVHRTDGTTYWYFWENQVQLVRGG